jgi:UDP-N-acetylglucosamine 1-carboxyvinyltransferase
VPHLADVESLIRILGNHGVDYSVTGRRQAEDSDYARTVHFTARNIVDITAPYELVSKMRASFWVIGPLLARMGEARVSLPGGCAIGTRPVDLFIEVSGGARRRDRDRKGLCHATAKNGLIGAQLQIPQGLGRRDACGADGRRARQGRHDDRQSGARAGGRQSRRLPQRHGREDRGRRHRRDPHSGVTSLSGARHRVIPDRIETGTYAMAVGMTGGDVMPEGRARRPARERARRLREAGIEITDVEDGIRVYRNGNGLMPVDVAPTRIRVSRPTCRRS